MREPKVEVDWLESHILVQLSHEIHVAEAQNQTASHESILVLICPIPRQPVLLYTAGEPVDAISRSQLIVRGWCGLGRSKMPGSEAKDPGEREPRRLELLGWGTKVESVWVRVRDAIKWGRMVVGKFGGLLPSLPCQRQFGSPWVGGIRCYAEILRAQSVPALAIGTGTLRPEESSVNRCEFGVGTRLEDLDDR